MLFKEFYFNNLRLNFGTQAINGRTKINVDVKCEEPVMVQFDGPIIFVSNEYPYGDDSFLRRVHVVCVDRACADCVEEV